MELNFPLNKIKRKTYKTCFVPMCKSTTIKNPNKVFFQVPKDENLKKKWFEIAHREYSSTKTNFFCCEDHFDIKDDMENYIRFTIYGDPCTLKSGVIPHKFECQPHRVSVSQELNREAYKKINRKREIQEILSENSCDLKENRCVNIQEYEDQEVQEVCGIPIAGTSSSSYGKPRKFGEQSTLIEEIEAHKLMVSCGIQVHKSDFLPRYRSKSIICKPLVKDFSCEAKPEKVDAACSPKSCSSPESKKNLVDVEASDIFLSSPEKNSRNSNEYFVPSESGSTSTFEDEKVATKEIKQEALKLTKYFITTSPKEYIGILPQCLWIIDLLKKYSDISDERILLTLMKIKTNDSFSRLGTQFGLCMM